jgi:hypothetical protein
MSQAAVTQQPPAAGPARPYTGRNFELALLGLSTVIVFAALILVQVAQSQSLTWDIAKYIGAYMLLFGFAHLVVRRFAPYADPVILPLVATLNGLGLVIIHRLDLGTGQNGETASPIDRTHDADQQVLWAVLGIIAFVAVLILIRDHRTLSRYSYILGLGGLIFLAIPAILPSSMSEINGSKI